MAKAKARNQTEPETVNIVDYLTEKLEERTGIPFARDAWENAAPDNYGVVELGGTEAEQWADGKLIDAIYRITVTLYVTGCEDSWIDTIGGLLEELEEQDIITAAWTTGREFMMDTGKVQWTWNLRAYGPIVARGAGNGTDGN